LAHGGPLHANPVGKDANRQARIVHALESELGANLLDAIILLFSKRGKRRVGCLAGTLWDGGDAPTWIVPITSEHASGSAGKYGKTTPPSMSAMGQKRTWARGSWMSALYKKAGILSLGVGLS
jgi:hypothetical protein